LAFCHRIAKLFQATFDGVYLSDRILVGRGLLFDGKIRLIVSFKLRIPFSFVFRKLRPIRICLCEQRLDILNSLPRQLGILCNQMERLQAIQTTDRQRGEAERDQKIWKYLEIELRAEAAEEERKDLARQIVVTEEALVEDRKRLAELDTELSRLRQEVDALKAAINATEEGKLYLSLRQRNRELVADIERLKGIGKTVDEAVESRSRQAQRWIKLSGTLPIEVNSSSLKEFSRAVEQLGTGPKRQLREQVRNQARAALALRQAVESAARDIFPAPDCGRCESFPSPAECRRREWGGCSRGKIR